jgi:hypothetical protein
VVNRNLLSSKLAELADRVNRIRPFGALSADELTANRDAFDLASFNLMLAVQICAGIAAHLIADGAGLPQRISRRASRASKSRA